MRKKPRETRTYRHRRCDGRTTVDGGDLVYVCNVLSHPDRTYCADCDDYFPMREFDWDDTGERITDYYDRHGERFSNGDRFIASGKLMFALAGGGALAGGVVGFAVGRLWNTPAAVVAAVVGVVVLGGVGFVVGAQAMLRVYRRVLGTDDMTRLD